jgi:CelD/BcsL family acetyltransferase involved in cellulose biosynthesis
MSISSLSANHDARPVSTVARATRAATPAQGAALAQDITTLHALERLVPEWEKLYAQAPHATPFQSPHWLMPWWKHLGRGTLATIAVRCVATGELVALAPLYVHVDPCTGMRQLFPIGIATSDYLDVLVRPSWEGQAMDCLGSHLAQHIKAWDVLEFPQLRQGAALRGLVAPAGCRRELVEGEPNPVMMLGGSQLGADPPIPPSMARNLRYCRTRAARAGSVSYHTADARTLPDFLEALVRLHVRRWSERGQAGVLNGESVLAWHREAARLLQGAGLLRMHALCHLSEFIAVLYCLVDAVAAGERWCYYYLGGFDPRFRALSPGTLLVAHAIEQARAEGATAFDFLRGSEAYKYRWGAVDRPTCTLRLWPERFVSARRTVLGA